MARANVQVKVHDTDGPTWAALAQVFDVVSADGEGGRHEWIELRDRATDVQVTFFAPLSLRGPEEGEPVPPGPAQTEPFRRTIDMVDDAIAGMPGDAA